PEERPTMAEVAAKLGRYTAMTGALPALNMSAPGLTQSGVVPVVSAPVDSSPSIPIEQSSTLGKAAGETSQRGHVRSRARLPLMLDRSANAEINETLKKKGPPQTEKPAMPAGGKVVKPVKGKRHGTRKIEKEDLNDDDIPLVK